MPENTQKTEALPPFREVAEQFYQPLYRFGFSLAKNEADASDLVQQTFLIYADKGQSLRDPSKVKSWLFTTLYREFLRLRRKGERETGQEPEVLEAAAPPVTPDMVTALDADQAMDSLTQVDEIYREPLVLFYVQDLSYKEISEILDIPMGTVMSRLSRGKSQLKKVLSGKKRK